MKPVNFGLNPGNIRPSGGGASDAAKMPQTGPALKELVQQGYDVVIKTDPQDPEKSSLVLKDKENSKVVASSSPFPWYDLTAKVMTARLDELTRAVREKLGKQ